MVFARVEKNAYLLRLEKGEELNSTIKEFCKKEHIKNAWLFAIGSIENPTLAHYQVDTKKYQERKLSGIFELISLSGNVALYENQPLVHIHVAISEEHMNAYAGHLVSSLVSATVEVYLTAFSSSYKKSFSQEIGLKLWDLPQKCSLD